MVSSELKSPNAAIAAADFRIANPENATHLLKVISQLNDRRRPEQPVLINDQLPVLK